MIVQILKGFCAALAQTFGGLWRACGRKTRWTLTILLVVLVAAFVAKRARDSFSSEPPDWLRQKERQSPALASGAWQQFETMLKQGRSYADQKLLPLAAVRLVEVEPDLKETVSWSTDTFVNPGFGPLQRFERSFRIEPQRFIGYYTREGKPLEFTVKHTPTRPKDLLMTVHMPGPVAAGAAEMVFRLERQADRVKPTKEGHYQVWFGRMPPPDSAVQLWGVRLPERAKLIRCLPEKGAAIASNGVIQISWVNVRLDPSAPPVSVVFSMLP
jgi:hypothetical protein